MLRWGLGDLAPGVRLEVMPANPFHNNKPCGAFVHREQVGIMFTDTDVSLSFSPRARHMHPVKKKLHAQGTPL